MVSSDVRRTGKEEISSRTNIFVSLVEDGGPKNGRREARVERETETRCGTNPHNTYSCCINIQSSLSLPKQRSDSVSQAHQPDELLKFMS